MRRDCLFLDTAFIQALLNPRDRYHQQAKQLLSLVRSASEVWTTEAILVEVGNALSSLNRDGAERSPFFTSRFSPSNDKRMIAEP